MNAVSALHSHLSAHVSALPAVRFVARAADPGLKSEDVCAGSHTVETRHSSNGQEVCAGSEKIPERKGKERKPNEAKECVGVKGYARHPPPRACSPKTRDSAFKASCMSRSRALISGRLSMSALGSGSEPNVGPQRPVSSTRGRRPRRVRVSIAPNEPCAGLWGAESALRGLRQSASATAFKGGCSRARAWGFVLGFPCTRPRHTPAPGRALRGTGEAGDAHLAPRERSHHGRYGSDAEQCFVWCVGRSAAVRQFCRNAPLSYRARSQ